MLEADILSQLAWWIDAAFAVHHDMMSHTRSVLLDGKGAVYATSTKQKLNTHSSTKSELVGINDVLPQVLWTQYFLEAQGKEIKDNVVYQDNQSVLRTHQINIHYFFVTYRIASGELTIDYCPTKLMVADFYTKPLRGKLFRIFCNRIL
eukprot:6466742-Ditylum_brightwellii.AAC.1